ncbi:MAG: DNA primase large subunit PriL, partial [Candidatus Bathyarchaeia archaeon]
MVLITSDLAKYPFVPEAAEEVRKRDLKIENLTNPNYQPILSRAEKRIEEALLNNPPEVSYHQHEDDIEILSFPVAIVLTAASSNDYIKKRYALAEAKRAYELLQNDEEEKVMEIARTFNWKIRMSHEKINQRKFPFAIHFTDFLRNIEPFYEKEWKLINQTMLKGEVYLTKQDVARLLQEEIRRYIELKLSSDVRSMLPDGILERVDKLKQAYSGREKQTPFEELPEEVINDAFPPCIRRLYNLAKSGGHLSHVGRFTLTSFLLRAGMEPSQVVDLFRVSSDFNERLTRYQVEHIAGGRGSRTKYIPPKC